MIDGNYPSSEENIVESILGLSDQVFIFTIWPTEEQKKFAKNLSRPEREELFAFIRGNKHILQSLLNAKSPEEFQELQREIIMKVRLRETHFSKMTYQQNGTTQYYIIDRKEFIPWKNEPRRIIDQQISNI